MDQRGNRQPPTERRRSLAVPLTILGVAAAGVAGFASSFGPTSQRNLYETRADCEQDYSPAECTSTGTAGRTFIAGPVFRTGSTIGSPGPGRVGRNIVRIETVSTRGGFGSFGRSFGSGG